MSIVHWREWMPASSSSSLSMESWVLSMMFLRGRPRRRFAGATDEVDCEGFEDRSFGARCFFCSFSFTFIRTSSSSVMFNPVVLVNRFPRGGFVCARSFSSSRVRFAMSVLITLRTATMGLEGGCDEPRSEIDFSRIREWREHTRVVLKPTGSAWWCRTRGTFSFLRSWFRCEI